MAVKLAFIGRVPDADPEKHRCVIETPVYQLYVVMVENQRQAIEVCETLASKEGVDQITLCPAFTHRDVGEIAEVVGKNVAVATARRDGPGDRALTEAKKKELLGL